MRAIVDWIANTRTIVDKFMRSVVEEQHIIFPTRVTTATLPTASDNNEGRIVYVEDAAAGARFKGSNGVNWVDLG